MLIGYARVSTHDQSLDLQKDALRKAGCEKIIVDIGSGSRQDRSGIDQLREVLRKDDVLVVWRLDRLGRSLKHLIALIEELDEMGVGFQSITETIDTTSPSGRLFCHIIFSLAEFERNLIAERTKAGLAAARARGTLGGRPKKLNKTQQKLLRELYAGKKHSLKEICEMFGISKTTLYAYLA
ncbi:MAG: recombinase family protein [Pirellulaceae bacterium]